MGVHGSPGMDALGDVKQLQSEQKRKGQAIDKLVSPPMVGNSQLKNSITNTLPGGLTVVDGTSTDGAFRPAYQVRPDLNHMVLDIREVQKRIDTAFFADLFLMISRQDDIRTATEIVERKEEKLLMLGPVLERLQSELLDPLIDRTFNIMVRGGLIPPPPGELSGTELKVEYISPLAQAQRIVAVGSIERLTGFIGSVAQIDPRAADKMDVDQAIENYGEALGTNPKLIRPDDEVSAIREARAKQEEREQQLAAGSQVADSVEKLGNVDTSGNNIISGLINGVSS